MPTSQHQAPASYASPIGVGIIGLSARRGWAASSHLPALRSLPDYEVRALSASSPQSAGAAADRYGIATACDDPSQLIARPEVDLVVVTVKVPEHYGLVDAALSTGKSVLCEWPLGNGLAETEGLAACAEKDTVRGFVGLQGRSAPPIRYVADLVSSGGIGDVLATSMLASGDRWGATIEPEAAYLLDRGNGATLLTIPFGHAVDALCCCLGEFTELSATTATRRSHARCSDTGQLVPMTAEDQIAVTGTLQSGAVATIHYRGGRTAGTNFLWEIIGTAGDLVLRADTGHLQYGRVQVFFCDRSDGPLAPQTIPDRYHAAPHAPEGPAYTVAQAYARLAGDLRRGTRTVPTFSDALLRHRMLDAVQRAAATGTRQSYRSRPGDMHARNQEGAGDDP